MKGEQLFKELHVKRKLLLVWTAVLAAFYIHPVQGVPQLRSSLPQQCWRTKCWTFKRSRLLMCESFSGAGIWITLSHKITAMGTDLTWRLFSEKPHTKDTVTPKCFGWIKFKLKLDERLHKYNCKIAGLSARKQLFQRYLSRATVIKITVTGN